MFVRILSKKYMLIHQVNYEKNNNIPIKYNFMFGQRHYFISFFKDACFNG